MKRLLSSLLALSCIYGHAQDTSDVINNSIPQANVSSTGSNLKESIIFFDSSNNGIAFWHDATNHQLLSSFLPRLSTTWNTQTVVVPENAKNGPVAAINSSNRGILTWESQVSAGDKTPSLLYTVPFTSTSAGVVFGPITQASPNDQRCSAPAICITPNDEILVAWINESTPKHSVWIARGVLTSSTSVSWSDQQQVFLGTADSGSLSISVNGSGDGTLIWRDKITDFTQYYSINFHLSHSSLGLGSVISLPVSAVSPSTGNQDGGLVSVDNFGNAFAVWFWSENTSFHDILQYSVLYRGSSSWSPLQTLSTSANAQKNDKLSMNGSGFGAIVWDELDVSDGSTPIDTRMITFQINTSNRTVSLGNTVILTGSATINPNVFVDRRNNVVASWLSKSGSYYVRTGLLPRGSSTLTSVNQISTDTVYDGESSVIYLNALGFGGAIWSAELKDYIQAARLTVYNPAEVLLNTPVPTTYLTQ